MDLPAWLDALLIGVALLAGNKAWEHLTRQRCGARKGWIRTCGEPVARRPGERCELHKGMPLRLWP